MVELAAAWGCAAVIPTPHDMLSPSHNNGLKVTKNTWWDRYYDTGTWPTHFPAAGCSVSSEGCRGSQSHDRGRPSPHRSGNAPVARWPPLTRRRCECAFNAEGSKLLRGSKLWRV
eukprot:78636-Prymnesium_polylepis.3